jgi:outer membrane lipoprotein SlyB
MTMADNPYNAPSARVEDIQLTTKVEISWKRTLSVWWSFVWRSAIYGFVGGALLGAVSGAIAGATGHLDMARLLGMLGGYIAGMGLSIIAMKQTLEKHLPLLVKGAPSI